MKPYYKWGIQTRWFMVDWTWDRPGGFMIIQPPKPFAFAIGPLYIRIGSY